MRNCPQRVGRSALAIWRTDSNGMLRLYVSAFTPIRCARPLIRSSAQSKTQLSPQANWSYSREMAPDTNLILIPLLVELGVAAAGSSSLARLSLFKTLLVADPRPRRQTLKLLAMICVPLTLGVWVRVTVPNFLAADISLEATILLGLILGPMAAMLGGVALAIPAVLHHEFWALPINLLVAGVAGAFRHFV